MNWMLRLVNPIWRCTVVAACLNLSACSLFKGLNSLVAPVSEEQAKQEVDDHELNRVEFLSFRTPLEKTNPDTIEILTTRPNEKYIELGVLTVRSLNATNGGIITGGHVESYEELIPLLKRKAASVGADAIVNFQTKQVAVKINETNKKLRQKNEVSGTAISYVKEK